MAYDTLQINRLEENECNKKCNKKRKNEECFLQERVELGDEPSTCVTSADSPS